MSAVPKGLLAIYLVSGCKRVPSVDASHYNTEMRHTLRPHPSSQVVPGTVIEAEVERRRTDLSLRYSVSGRDLLLPSLVEPARTDGLWRNTCFEAFVCMTSGVGYYEFNFAPSTQWAAYRFTGYRTGMSLAGLTGAPELRVQSTDGHFELTAMVALVGLPDLPLKGAWKVGLSAVIEDTSGSLSYWALAHPIGRADFHHADCFSLELPAA